MYQVTLWIALFDFMFVHEMKWSEINLLGGIHRFNLHNLRVLGGRGKKIDDAYHNVVTSNLD